MPIGVYRYPWAPLGAHGYAGARIGVYTPRVISDDDPRPWYEQIADVLKQRIQDGTIQREMPSKREIADEAGVSLGTVDNALKILRDQGWIQERAGKTSLVIIGRTRTSGQKP